MPVCATLGNDRAVYNEGERTLSWIKENLDKIKGEKG